jgi:hypothetical protein
MLKYNIKKNSVFWEVMPCTPVKVNWYFGGTYCLHLHEYAWFPIQWNEEEKQDFCLQGYNTVYSGESRQIFRSPYLLDWTVHQESVLKQGPNCYLLYASFVFGHPRYPPAELVSDSPSPLILASRCSYTLRNFSLSLCGLHPVTFSL